MRTDAIGDVIADLDEAATALRELSAETGIDVRAVIKCIEAAGDFLEVLRLAQGDEGNK